MSGPDILNVWHEQCLVGLLWRNSAGAIGFGYDLNQLTHNYCQTDKLRNDG